MSDGLEDLERIPAMIDENLLLKVRLLVSIHNEPTRLRETIDRTGVSVEDTARLHLSKADSTRRFVVFVVVDGLVDASVVLVKVGERLDHVISHWPIKPECLAFHAGLTHLFEASFGGGEAIRQLVEAALITEADCAGRMLHDFDAMFLYESQLRLRNPV